MTRVVAILCLGVVLVGCDHAPRPSSYVPTTPTATPQPSPPRNYSNEPIVGAGVTISVGDVAQATVQPDDPVCFPNWDLSGRCRQYDLTALRDGTLEIRLAWTEPAWDRQMTSFVVNDSIGWITSEWSPVVRDVTEAWLRLPVRAGHPYHLLVMSYGPPQSFEMTTTLR